MLDVNLLAQNQIPRILTVFLALFLWASLKIASMVQ